MTDEHQLHESASDEDASPPMPPQSIELQTCPDALLQRRDDVSRPLFPERIRAGIRGYRCGYLPRGLKADGMCPECACPIQDSIAARGLRQWRNGLISPGWPIAAIACGLVRRGSRYHKRSRMGILALVMFNACPVAWAVTYFIPGRVRLPTFH